MGDEKGGIRERGMIKRGRGRCRGRERILK
jgi:hypothetical protein